MSQSPRRKNISRNVAERDGLLPGKACSKLEVDVFFLGGITFEHDDPLLLLRATSCNTVYASSFLPKFEP